MFRFSILFLFLFLLSNAQERSYPDIDSALIYGTYNLERQGKFKEAIHFNFDLVAKSRKKDYTNGIVLGYINIGNTLCTLNRYEESLKYFELAERRIHETTDFQLKAKLYTDTGKVYHFLELYTVALDYYNKGIRECEKIEDSSRKKKLLSYSYACKADNFYPLKQYDSVYIYFQKAYKILPDPITAANISHYLIVGKKKQIDSAKYYLDAASSKLNTNKYGLFQKLIVLKTYGEFYSEKKVYNKALSYYFQSLAIAIKLDRKDEESFIYQLISKTYKVLQKENEATEYLQKYIRLSDSLNAVNKRALNISVEKLMKDKDSEKQIIRYNTYYVFVFTFCIIVILLIWGYTFYKKNKKEKESIIQRQQEEIVLKEVEKSQLNNKINEAFEEVMQMAKNNDPKFLARFKEVYPEFCERILNLQPNMLKSEFIFCAYLKLNLSTKEIASYTFVTEKTVQSRKSRLRKKMMIPSDVDLYIWINKI